MKKLLAIGAITLFAIGSPCLADTSSMQNYSIEAASNSDTPSQAPNQLFTYVTDFDSLKDQIMKSINNNTPVLIEFYATWCHYCQAADANVFSDPDVQKAMGGVTAIRVDASEGTAEQVNMMNSYNVSGFPSFIIYDKSGVMSSPSELSGSVTKSGMLKVLNRLKS